MGCLTINSVKFVYEAFRHVESLTKRLFSVTNSLKLFYCLLSAKFIHIIELNVTVILTLHFPFL
jgi:hypothetical protein